MAISHVVGFDDGPFPRAFRGDVPVVGCVFSEATFTGVVSGKVRKDGRNATEVLARLVTASKWALVEAAGPMEPCAGVFVQRAGLTLEDAADVIRRTAVHGRVPEPLRAAHLVAGGVYGGESRGRA